MFGQLNFEDVENVLHHQILGRIGCHFDQTTYVVPISYAYDGEYIYALTTEGLKLNIMRQNPQVCFEVEEIPDLANWKSVICWGEFEEIVDSELRYHALSLLNERHTPHVTSATTRLYPSWPFLPERAEEVEGVVFRIKLQKRTGKFEKQEEKKIYPWI